MYFFRKDKGHDEEVREIEQILPRPDTFHIVHDHQVQVQIQHGHDPGQQKFPPQVQMIRHDKEIGGAQVDQCADIQLETEKGNDAYKVRDEDQQDELIESDRLLSLGCGILLPDAGIDNVLIKGPEKRNDRVAQR
jgi:hypothetical protein